jgi:hypothetical protein
MPEPTPKFANEDNKLIWSELVHIKEMLTKINGAVGENTEYRIMATERWRTHEEKHKAVDRNNVIGSGLGGGLAFIAALIKDLLV